MSKADPHFYFELQKEGVTDVSRFELHSRQLIHRVYKDYTDIFQNLPWQLMRLKLTSLKKELINGVSLLLLDTVVPLQMCWD
ncbi:MAG: hypothetical protein J0M15_16415 [Deltaproteobacteria bacterium]|nr:hypothetical protein [Deltaproteobacteria bacterium]